MTARPRILIVSCTSRVLDDPAYDRQELGLATALAAGGADVVLAGAWTKADELSRSFERRTVRYRTLGQVQSLISSRLVEPGERFDAIHVSDITALAVGQILLTTRVGRVIAYHGVYSQPAGPRRFMTSLNARLLARRRHTIFVKTACAERFLADFGLAGRILPPGISRPLQESPLDLDLAAFLGDSEETILYAGALEARRPLEWCLEALRDPRLTKARLLVIGDGTDRAMLIQRFGDLVQDGRVLFAGIRTRPQVTAAMAAAKVFVNPTRREIWGMALAEAVWTGAACLASPEAGPRTIAERFPENVALVADPKTWADSIERALTRPRPGSPPDRDWLLWEARVPTYLSALAETP